MNNFFTIELWYTLALYLFWDASVDDPTQLFLLQNE